MDLAAADRLLKIAEPHHKPAGTSVRASRQKTEDNPGKASARGFIGPERLMTARAALRQGRAQPHPSFPADRLHGRPKLPPLPPRDLRMLIHIAPFFGVEDDTGEVCGGIPALSEGRQEPLSKLMAYLSPAALGLADAILHSVQKATAKPEKSFPPCKSWIRLARNQSRVMPRRIGDGRGGFSRELWSLRVICAIGIEKPVSCRTHHVAIIEGGLLRGPAIILRSRRRHRAKKLVRVTREEISDVRRLRPAGSTSFGRDCGCGAHQPTKMDPVVDTAGIWLTAIARLDGRYRVQLQDRRASTPGARSRALPGTIRC